MGIATSKVCTQLPQKDLQEGSIPSTPIVAPKVIKHDNLDPRSPSTHISRTPLQLLPATTLKLDKLRDNITMNADETPAKTKNILLGIDPRSPTAEFNRTPIIINVPASDNAEKIHNKNLEKVKRSVITVTPKSNSKRQVCEKVTCIVQPKLLESSPIKTTMNTNRRKSFVGLLETNIDFTETDLDAVIRKKNKDKESVHTLNEISTPKHVQVGVLQREIDPRSPTSDFLRTPIQIIKKISDLDLNKEINSGSIHIKKVVDHSQIAMELQDHNIIEKCVQEICEEVHLRTELDISENQSILQTDIKKNIVSFEIPVMDEINQEELDNAIREDDNKSDSGIPVEIKSAPITPATNSDSVKPAVMKETKSAPVTPPIVNLTTNVQEFDKKLTDLIYHDEDVIICPRKVKLKDYDTRSPLKNLNSSGPIKKTEKLKVNDKVKSEFAVSKIPVFKEKNKKTEVQCENTPPRNMEKRKMKVRKSHWDNADTTLII